MERVQGRGSFYVGVGDCSPATHPGADDKEDDSPSQLFPSQNQEFESDDVRLACVLGRVMESHAWAGLCS